LLGIDIYRGEPAAEARVGVVPSHDSLWPRELDILANKTLV
jgi:hypothetical protein